MVAAEQLDTDADGVPDVYRRPEGTGPDGS
jgi:hypothetical protein